MKLLNYFLNALELIVLSSFMERSYLLGCLWQLMGYHLALKILLHDINLQGLAAVMTIDSFLPNFYMWKRTLSHSQEIYSYQVRGDTLHYFGNGRALHNSDLHLSLGAGIYWKHHLHLFKAEVRSVYILLPSPDPLFVRFICYIFVVAMQKMRLKHYASKYLSELS